MSYTTRLHWRCCSFNIHIQRFDSFHLFISSSLSDLGSVSSCDAFLNIFQSHGLKPEVICPCATSPEAMTVALRRYIILLTNCRDPCSCLFPDCEMFLQTWGPWCSSSSESHPVHDWAEPWGHQGQHWRQKLCSHRPGCGTRYAWRCVCVCATNVQQYTIKHYINASFIHSMIILYTTNQVWNNYDFLKCFWKKFLMLTKYLDKKCRKTILLWNIITI